MIMSQAKVIKEKVSDNVQSINILSTEQLLNAWQKVTNQSVSDLMNSVRFSSNFAAAALDSITVMKVIKDLGINGSVVLKTVGAKQYVIFKGYAGLRSIFTATRYLSTNVKVVDMAIGKVGVRNSIISGTRLTIYLIVPMNIINVILSDEQSMSRLIGSTSTDLIKLGIAGILAAIVSASGVAATYAVGPLIVAIAVGLLVSAALDAMDNHFGVTEALIKFIDNSIDNTVGSFAREIDRVERELQWKIINGLPLGLSGYN
ncbi:MAG: hypothetical protein ACI935_000681 [Moritella dasanensis]|jgi:hypothetical protein